LEELGSSYFSNFVSMLWWDRQSYFITFNLNTASNRDNYGGASYWHSICDCHENAPSWVGYDQEYSSRFRCTVILPCVSPEGALGLVALSPARFTVLEMWLILWKHKNYMHIALFVFMLVSGFGRLWSTTCVMYCLRTGRLHMHENYYRVLLISRL